MNQRKMGVILSYIYTIISTVVNLMYVPLLLGYLGNNEYGLYQLMGSMIAYLSIMNFGMSTVITRFYSNYSALDDERNKENVLSLSLIIYTCLSFVTIIIAAILYFQLDVIFENSLTNTELINAKKIFIVLVFNLIVSLMVNTFEAVINSHERFIFIRAVSILQIVIQPIMVIALLKVSPTAFSVVLVQSILLIIVSIAKVIYCFLKLNTVVRYHYFDRKLFLEMLALAGSVFLVTMADQVLWRSNQIILGIISGTAAVSVYAIATQIYTNYMCISTIFSNVFLPKVTRMVAQKEKSKSFSDLFIRIGRVQFLILACLLSGFLLFGEDFITLWAGKDFIDAYWITLIIIFPFTIDLIQNIGIVIMQAKNQYGFRAKIMIIIAVLNIALAIPLLTHFGGVGGAAATGFSIFIGNGLVMNWYFLKKLKIDILKFWIEISKIALVVMICIFLGYLLNQVDFPLNAIVSLAVRIMIYLTIYCSLCWSCAMNQYEKNLIAKPILKVINKVWNSDNKFQEDRE